MTNHNVRARRVVAGIPGSLVAQKAAISRGRLSEIERGYVEPLDEELTRIDQALRELIAAREKVSEVAAQVGWPGPV